ncbi:kynurenine--oxoglutarate transaminase [Legionella busanensis]|uniref:Kynurenine--oxoglutarate transaminase n=1 Tax=Legionella busanensis TaxID=190655 RepID=A0A378JN05_9GAMM|nr:pyridoxal phosphate-dependent aminotransferase [Legionella busanensis]STX52457.1 kynurenine--oxoglutarate transaminase [Legionella busanensis]
MDISLLAHRTNLPVNAIDEIFAQLPYIHQERLEKGLPSIIDLSIGEPHLAINPNVSDAMTKLLQKKDLAFPYSLSQGERSCLEAVTALYKHYYPLVNFSTKEVMVTYGATQALWHAFNILINPDDSVLVFEPYFGIYEMQLNLLGAQLIKIPTEAQGFQPSIEQLEFFLIKFPNTKVLILNFPNNPTGIDLQQSFLIGLAKILEQNLYLSVIIDDVYRELTTSPHITLLDVAPHLKNRCLVINSASKGLIGAPGLRIGMIGANPLWIEKMSTLQMMMTGGISVLMQQALIASIKEKLILTAKYQAWLNKCLHDYQRNRVFIYEQLRFWGFQSVASDNGFFVLTCANPFIDRKVPDKVNFMFNNKSHQVTNLHNKLNTTTFKTDSHIASFILYTVGVAIVPGSAFGIDEKKGYLRFSYAKDYLLLQQACKLIQDIVEQVNYINSKA